VAAEKLLTAEGRATLAKVLPALEATDWSGPALEEAARAFAAAEGLKLGQVAQPLRAAVTGKSSSPPLFETLAVLGRDESLARLRAYTQ
ncbi:MAG: glutamate--tRNA ligase, partial [Alphaproteobacteria bacterium]|nr:glutamate--tRNA ligase [Alphaproteobacteria bacterium]